ADPDRLAPRPRLERRRARLSRRDVQQPRAPQQHLGTRLRPAHQVHPVGWAGSFDADFQKSLRSLFSILRTKDVKFGVLAKERCNGDPAKRTGNEYMYQELANGNIDDL